MHPSKFYQMAKEAQEAIPHDEERKDSCASTSSDEAIPNEGSDIQKNMDWLLEQQEKYAPKQLMP